MKTFFNSSILHLLFITVILLSQHLTAITAKSIDLSDYGLCKQQGDSTDCNFACSDFVPGSRGNCIFNKCYCTEQTEVGKCEEDDHESCDALCQDMSSSFIGFCMDNQCNCLT